MVCGLFGTAKREVPLNKEFFYPLIYTKYNGEIYISVLNQYYNLVLNNIKDIDFTKLDNKHIIAFFKKIFSDVLENFEVKEMYRMYRETKLNITGNDAVLLNESNKKYFMNTGKKSNDVSFKEKKWKELKNIIDTEMIYIIKTENKITSMAYVSDIFAEGANIVVSTDEKNRKKGYGKKVVAQLTNSIIERKLLPIYFVNVNNKPSINLAKSLGYINIADEIVVCFKK